MDDREKFNETLLPEKEDFYSHLNMEDISDADYTYAKRVYKDFKIKKLGEYYNFFLNVINGIKRYHTIHFCMWELIKKYMKDYDNNKESSYLKYWDVIVYMDGQFHKSYL